MRNGLTNHAPMVAQALHCLGLDAHIQPWVAAALPECVPRPPITRAIEPAQWQQALGDATRFSDWAGLFEQTIDRRGWAATLTHWVPRLSPGFAAAAAHGIIRTGHAARALTETDTQVRRMELADALASWASQYGALHTEQGAELRLSPSVALSTLHLVDPQHRTPPGSITSALAVLTHDQPFAAHFNALDVNDDPDQLSLDVAATFARLFCQSADTPLRAIVFTHAITGVAAARHLFAYVDEQQTRLLIRQAFFTGCALHRVYSPQPYTPPAADPFAPGVEECVYDALAHGDEHVIKLTEACVAFDEATGDAFFLTAAERCRRLLPPRS